MHTKLQHFLYIYVYIQNIFCTKETQPIPFCFYSDVWQILKKNLTGKGNSNQFIQTQYCRVTLRRHFAIIVIVKLKTRSPTKIITSSHFRKRVCCVESLVYLTKPISGPPMESLMSIFIIQLLLCNSKSKQLSGIREVNEIFFLNLISSRISQEERKTRVYFVFVVLGSEGRADLHYKRLNSPSLAVFQTCAF